jgi:hypothetical protein
MKRVIAGSFMAAAFAVGLSAQTTPPQTAPPAGQPMQDAAKTVTVAGCLKAGDTADSFTLSDLKWNKDKAPGAVGTSGSAGAPPAAIASATSLKLIPSASTKLADHVGHQVEVTGTVSEKSAAAARPSTPPSDPASARPSASASGPALDVRTVKMIAASCSQ